jgi:tRNA G37 N-methylase TrmD
MESLFIYCNRKQRKTVNKTGSVGRQGLVMKLENINKCINSLLIDGGCYELREWKANVSVKLNRIVFV